MLPGWCCIAIAALELGNGDSWYHMCAFRFHFWGRKVNWNQASHVRASPVGLVWYCVLDNFGHDLESLWWPVDRHSDDFRWHCDQCCILLGWFHVRTLTLLVGCVLRLCRCSHCFVFPSVAAISLWGSVLTVREAVKKCAKSMKHFGFTNEANHGFFFLWYGRSRSKARSLHVKKQFEIKCTLTPVVM